MTRLSCLLLAFFISCQSVPVRNATAGNEDIHVLFENYWEERMRLYPLEATQAGDNRYNHLLRLDITEAFRDTLRGFYSRYLTAISRHDPRQLNANDRISYDIFKREMAMNLEDLGFPDHYIPFQQFWGLPLTIGQLGSGQSSQPFKTVADYRNWLSRVETFSIWADSAIANFRKGMAAGRVLPKALVLKMIPQLRQMAVTDTAKSIFYGPLRQMPGSFSAAQRDSLADTFHFILQGRLFPAFGRMASFLQNEYLPNARTTSGISDIPGGRERYAYLIREWTTTGKTAEEIYQTGLAEVARIRGEMERVKDSVGFLGNLNAFFDYMRDHKQFMPFRTAEEVLAAYRAILQRIDPNLKKMFGRTPRTPFEIRQTEAFRAASAAAEYQQGTPDGSRPGVFYVPVVDAARYNTTSGMESLFLHEAIPGHHYQISLQQEQERLPKFRRFSWYGAYGEGWALYAESLGKELGLYSDPYQYMGALGDEMHRAIRLVVDVGIHTRGMTREEAIKYMTGNEAISTEGATAEIERYMAIPAQALSYKIGALKIRALREKYEEQLGAKFSLSGFHDELLKDGCMPLDVLERKMDDWAAAVRK